MRRDATAATGATTAAHPSCSVNARPPMTRTGVPARGEQPAHPPLGDNAGSWRFLEQFQRSGVGRAVGSQEVATRGHSRETVAAQRKSLGAPGRIRTCAPASGAGGKTCRSPRAESEIVALTCAFTRSGCPAVPLRNRPYPRVFGVGVVISWSRSRRGMDGGR